MPGGTALISGAILSGEMTFARPDEFVSLRVEAILEYEQTIAELRSQLLHYKRLVAQLLGPAGGKEDHEQPIPVIPADPASVRVVNSIVRAKVPTSATFREFDDGEL